MRARRGPPWRAASAPRPRAAEGVAHTAYKPARVKATLIEKRGVCPYDVGHTIIYGRPVDNPRPSGECWGITHPLAPIVMACALGFKSWEKDNPDRYFVSCISKRGTVWRVERLDKAQPGTEDAGASEGASHGDASQGGASAGGRFVCGLPLSDVLGGGGGEGERERRGKGGRPFPR